MTRISVKLRKHKGRLCKTIGKSLGRNGKPTKKTFYFPSEEPAVAIRRVLELKAEWRRLRAAGLTVWEESPLYLHDHRQEAVSIRAEVKPLTIKDAATLYIEAIEVRMKAGQVSRSHYATQKFRLQIGTSSIIDLPLSVVTAAKLQDVVLGIASRPLVRRGRGITEHQMSANYAKSILSTMRWFFFWCDEAGHWNAPRSIKSVFKSRPVLSASEQEAELIEEPEVDRFTLQELQSLWNVASDFQRTLILLSMNCGFANSECSTFRRSEWKGATIERFRRKTVKIARRGSYGKWSLWSETIEFLKRNQAPQNEWEYVLLNEAGRPLVEDCERYHKDEICHQWTRLLGRASTRKLGFKFMRKTAAYLIRVRLGFGREIADAFLSHADFGIIKHYSGRNWEGVKKATDALRAYLSPIFEVAENGGR